jgi:drug/metabolite transporter (DMT)-like permease
MKLFWLTALAMVAFAANSVLTRVALTGGSDPFAFAALRVVSGAVTLMVLVRFRGAMPALALSRRLPAAAALAVYMLCFSISYLSLPSGAGALILFGSVQLSMFAGAVCLRETVPLRHWIGGALALGGLAYLLWPEVDTNFALFATLAMVSAGIGWGVYSLIGRNARDPVTDTAMNFTLAIVPTGLVWIVLQGTLTTSGVLLAMTAGMITSGLGYALWYGILPRLGASRAGVAQLSVPIIAMAGGFVFLNEAVTMKFVIASVLVLGGIGISMMRQPRKRQPRKR